MRHKDQQVNLILSVHDEIQTQSIELQKTLYPSWINRTNNYFKDLEMPEDVKICMRKAKALVGGTENVGDSNQGGATGWVH